MHSETRRFGSFNTCAAYGRALSWDLAKAGFFYTGTKDIVICAFCQGFLQKWELGDDPMVEHLKHFPRCPFVLGLERVQYLELPPRSVPVHTQYSEEYVRLCSFRRWPTGKEQNPRDLAVAGFFYAGSGDCVWCFNCGGGFKNWLHGQDPQFEHARYFPHCEFIIKQKADRSRQMTNLYRTITRTEGTPVLCSQYSLFPLYEDLDKRFQSFQCMSDSGVTNLNQLAPAGFFYDPEADTTMCFCCGMTLNFTDENPFTVHERESPDCEYISKLPGVFPAFAIAPRKDLTKDQLLAVLRQVTDPLSDEPPVVRHKENNRLREQQRCKVCLKESRSVVFIPCGHFACCCQCSPHCSQCPICSMAVWASVRVFQTVRIFPPGFHV